MVRMEKDGVKEFVFDCFIPYYRANGWKNEGESGEVQPLPEEPEQIFVCPHCGAKYEKQGSLKMHIKRKHPEQ